MNNFIFSAVLTGSLYGHLKLGQQKHIIEDCQCTMSITALLANGLFNYYKVTPGGSEEIYSFGLGFELITCFSEHNLTTFTTPDHGQKQILRALQLFIHYFIINCCIFSAKTPFLSSLQKIIEKPMLVFIIRKSPLILPFVF